MDELKLMLSSKFMKGIVTKLISKAIFKKYGYQVDIQLNEIQAITKDGKIHFHANVDAEISNEEFMKILKSSNLD